MVKDIKARDRPRFLSAQMKKAMIHTRNTAVKAVRTEDSTEDSRPEEIFQQTVENTTMRTAHIAVSGGRKMMHHGNGVVQARSDSPPIYEDAQWEEITPPRIPMEQSITEQGRQFARKKAETRTVRNRRIQERPKIDPSGSPFAKEEAQIRIKRPETTIKYSGRAIKGSQNKITVQSFDNLEKSLISQPHQSVSVKAHASQTARTVYTRRKEAKHAAEATEQAVKTIIRRILAAAKTLTASITAGMAIAVMASVIICLVGLMVASPFGIFFSREDSGTGYTMPDAITILNREFTQTIEQIKEEVAHDSVEMDNAGSAEMISNWGDVLAIYAVRTTTKDDAVEVASVTEEKLEILREIFWDMNSISYYTETVGNDEDGYSTVLHISVQTISCWEMVRHYHFDRKQQAMLEELMQPDYAELFQTLTGSYQNIDLSKEEIEDIIAHLPEDLSEERRQVILTAYQLVGKVDYFWGGKSYVMGWDPRWGTPMRVTSPGSSTTGTVRPFGLDCSGYVDWVFYNATNGDYTPSGGNGGTTAQKNNCTVITWADALPGDLVFYPRDTHVGIVCGYDEYGNPLVIHCASGWDTVVVTGKGAFTSVVRPEYYN